MLFTIPKKQIFSRSKKEGNLTENGKKMFIYQAAIAFETWLGFFPKINQEINRLLDL